MMIIIIIIVLGGFAFFAVKANLNRKDYGFPEWRKRNKR